MKRLISVIVLLMFVLFGCACVPDLPYNVLYDAKFVDTIYGFECKLQDMFETENDLIIEIFHDRAKPDEQMDSMPVRRCLTVKLNFRSYE